MKGIIRLFILLLLISSCIDSKNSTLKNNKLNASNYNCEVEVITNITPSLALDQASDTIPYALIRFEQRSGNFDKQWQLKRVKINNIQYFTFEKDVASTEDSTKYLAKVNEISVEHLPLKAEIQFVNEDQEIVEFVLDDIPLRDHQLQE